MTTDAVNVILPVFNEEGAIGAVVAEVVGALGGGAGFRVIVVDDGSVDDTPDILERLKDEFGQLVVVHHDRRRGYGAAIRSGFDGVDDGIVAVMDGDGQYDISDLVRLCLLVERGAPVVVGQRLHRADSAGRRLAGSLFSWMTNRLFRVSVADVNCGLKVFRSDLVPPDLTVSRGALFWAELLVRLRRSVDGFVEVAVSHRPRQTGRATGASPVVLLGLVPDLSRVVWSSLRRDGKSGRSESGESSVT